MEFNQLAAGAVPMHLLESMGWYAGGQAAFEFEGRNNNHWRFLPYFNHVVPVEGELPPLSAVSGKAFYFEEIMPMAVFGNWRNSHGQAIYAEGNPADLQRVTTQQLLEAAGVRPELIGTLAELNVHVMSR